MAPARSFENDLLPDLSVIADLVKICRIELQPAGPQALVVTRNAVFIENGPLGGRGRDLTLSLESQRPTRQQTELRRTSKRRKREGARAEYTITDREILTLRSRRDTLLPGMSMSSNCTPRQAWRAVVICALTWGVSREPKAICGSSTQSGKSDTARCAR